MQNRIIATIFTLALASTAFAGSMNQNPGSENHNTEMQQPASATGNSAPAMKPMDEESAKPEGMMHGEEKKEEMKKKRHHTEEEKKEWRKKKRKHRGEMRKKHQKEMDEMMEKEEQEMKTNNM